MCPSRSPPTILSSPPAFKFNSTSDVVSNEDMLNGVFKVYWNILVPESYLEIDILVPSGGDYLKIQGKERHVCSYVKDFQFDPKNINHTIQTLSGGEQNRLLLAKVLANPKTGLILD